MGDQYANQADMMSFTGDNFRSGETYLPSFPDETV